MPLVGGAEANGVNESVDRRSYLTWRNNGYDSGSFERRMQLLTSDAYDSANQ